MALFLLMALAVCPALAQEGWTREFGGNGEDSLPWMISAGDGLLIVGHTSSTDGDLKMRTRSGKAGWMLRLNAQGETEWSLCTAHVGRCEMGRPYAHADGTFSATLSAQGEGSEWLRVSEAGKVTARIALPQAQEACGHGNAKACYGVPLDRGGAAMLALMVTHEDGTRCCAVMDESGVVTHGAPVFALPHDGMIGVCRDGMGRIAAVSPSGGDAQVLWIVPGGQDAMTPIDVPIESGKLDLVLDVLPCVDGSVIFSGQLCATGSVVVRVSAAGETIFAVDDCENYDVLTHTAAGFAGVDDDEIAFYDEDGRLLGSASRVKRDAWLPSVAALGDGAAIVEIEDAAVRKPVRVTAVTSYLPASEEDYPEAAYARASSTLVAAAAADGRIVLDVRDSYDGAARVEITPNGTVVSETRTQDGAVAEGFMLPDGVMAWRETPMGAQVTLTAADGQTVFTTATPIHTAADRLQWLCAAQAADGGYLLGGRYLTEILANTEEKQIKRDLTRDGLAQEGVVAHLSADGVLMDVRTIQWTGCVAAILPGETEADTLLLCARSDRTDGLLSNIMTLDQQEWGALDIFLAPQASALLRMPEGVLAAGTNMKNGRPAVIVQTPERFAP